MARKTVLRRKDILIAGGASVLVLVAVLLVQILVIAPVLSDAAEHRAKLTGAVKELEKNHRKRQGLKDLEEKNRVLREQIATFGRRVPDKDNAVILFAEILQMATQHSLKVLGTEPMEPTPVGQGFIRYPYEINLLGGYTDLGRFIAAVETHANFHEIVKINLTSDGNGPVRAKVTLHLYTSLNAADHLAASTAHGDR
jgi:Tfp pilus assembly protein PilO